MSDEISIEGTLLMLDDTTPHVAVPVQAIRDGEVMATTLSDEGGRYRFIELKPGRYQVRCQILHGYVHYGEEKPTNLAVERGTPLRNIDFRFAPFKKGIWKNYNTLNGLTHNIIRTMYIDPDDVMWFGTVAGVSRYDGKEFVNFTTRDGLPGNSVYTICGDRDGAIWFGIYGAGVCRYDGKEFVTFTEEDGLAGNVVTGSACAPDGSLWFGTHNGVSRYDGKEFVTFTRKKDGLAHDRMHDNAIHCDADGTIWLGTEGGLSKYDGKKFVNLAFDEGVDENWNFIHSVYRDRDGFLWVGTRSGVLRYDGRDFIKLTHEDGLPTGFVVSIYQDLDGSMWFGMSSDHASRYDGKTFVNFTKEDGLTDRYICGIHRCPDGAIWFATGGSGVFRYDDTSIVVFTTKDGLVGDQVNAIYRDEEGNLWLGTPAGVSLYDGERFANFTQDDGLVVNQIMTICQGADRMMWFGTWQGISLYDNRQFAEFDIEEKWRGKHINAICCGPDGAMWIGAAFTGLTESGDLVRYDGNTIVSFTKEHGLVDNWVLSIHIDPHGLVWIGTSKGLSQCDGKEFINFTTKDGLVDNFVHAIHHDPGGMMWFGTICGLSRYDGKRFTNFTTEDGLAHGSVMAIHRASDGILWFGTGGGGVSLYDGTAWSSLDTRDGLGSNMVYAIDQDPDGSMWFGTRVGLVRYRRSFTPSQVHIVSVTIDKTYRDISAIPAIIAGQRVTIEYGSLDLKTVPEKQQYRCRVYETHDSLESVEYNPPTNETRFDWMPEKPGTYTFEVQSIDRDLNYSESAALSLTVQPDPVLAELNYLRQETSGKYHFDSIIGSSNAIKLVLALIEKAIDSKLRQVVLITGETGTGKELVAKAIHYNSPRKDKPMRDRNCGAIPKELLASDLFGHRKGAFTGADRDKIGLFEAASGGTLLLDEIGEMPQDAQVHLLRVLQENKVQRLGEHISRDVDVQIIAMTNRDLVEDVAAGRFREDLYYRLSEFPIHIPPLRERVEDIPLLAEHFLKETDREFSGFAPGVLEMLQNYSWPGNVRELRNAVRRAAALAEEGQQIQAHHLPSQITHEEPLVQESLSKSLKYSESVDRFRYRLITEALRQSNGNRNEAARRLGMDRSNLRALIKRLGIDI